VGPRIYAKRVQKITVVTLYPLETAMGHEMKKQESAENYGKIKSQQEEQDSRQKGIQEQLKASGPAITLQNGGALNTATGEFLAPTGRGYTGTQDGTFYTPSGSNGIINTRTGGFTPVFGK
jgi:hypothetical protein